MTRACIAGNSSCKLQQSSLVHTICGISTCTKVLVPQVKLCKQLLDMFHTSTFCNTNEIVSIDEVVVLAAIIAATLPSTLRYK